ncbi:MAG: alpha-L-fucosidase [Pseudomonadota bacterium]|jgi:alpha-L-fucosidase
MFNRRDTLLAAAALFSALPAAAADRLTDEQKSAAKHANADPTLAPDLLLPPKDLKWWRDDKFGVFVHWGLYAIPGKGEWHMYNDKVPAEDYAKLAQQFDPQHYDPDQWAQIALRAGARYMVLTTRHHDGFALWDSPASYQHYDAMHAAAHRDLVGAYVKALRRRNLRVGLYYSPLDWRFPAYFHPKELVENAKLFKQQTYGQVEELMRNYGPIDILWYDGGWLAHQGTDADAAWFWEPDKLNRMVRKYQPKVLINPRSGWQGDFDTEEGDAPIKGPIRRKPWEKCFSINRGAWGYTPYGGVMSPREVVLLLSNAAVRNGNVLANMGPDRDGVVPAAVAETLEGVGLWLAQYGEAIYATRPGPWQPVDGVYGAVEREGRIYLHIYSWPNEALDLPPLARSVTAVRNLSGESVKWRQDLKGVQVSVPKDSRGDPVTLLELAA